MENIASLKASTIADVQEVSRQCDVLRSELVFKAQAEQGRSIDRDRIASSMLVLRAANRNANLGAEELRKVANDARESIVAPKMRLENLVYLASQLKKEIQACKSYTGTYHSLELLSEKEAFPTAQGPDKSGDDRMMGRLEKELAERKLLQARLIELNAKRRRLEVENSSLTKFIEDLPTKVEAVVGALRPVKDFFFSSRIAKSPSASVKPRSFGRDELAAMSKLPTPLYIVYREAAAFRDAFDEGLAVTIDEKASGLKGLSFEGNDPSPSPLSAVRIHFREAIDSPKQIELVFRFIAKLGIVLLDCSSGVVSTDSLRLLYPGDDGSTSPNPQNVYLLNGRDLVEAAEGARPFLFAQLMCGLEFPDQIIRATGRNGEKIAWQRAAERAPLHARFGAIVHAVRHRVRCARALYEQLEALQKASTPSSAADAGLPIHTQSSFSAWKEQQASTTHPHPTPPASSASVAARRALTRTFTFDVTRAALVVKVEVRIRTDYPQRLPEWHLKCEDPSVTKEDRWEIVHELHRYAEDYLETNESPERLLGCALQRLLACVDVLVETEAEVEGTQAQTLVERPRWERAFRGKSRRRPFHFNTKIQLFEQRPLSNGSGENGSETKSARAEEEDNQEDSARGQTVASASAARTQPAEEGSEDTTKSGRKRANDESVVVEDEQVEREVADMEL